MEINNSFSPIDIALSGLHAQSKNLEIISSNIANAQSVDSSSGEPYRRLEVVFKADDEDGVGGVLIDEIITDMSNFNQIYRPGHPKADEQGYLRVANVNLPVEMINLNMATRAYQANAAILKRYQRMVETSLELLR